MDECYDCKARERCLYACEKGSAMCLMNRMFHGGTKGNATKTAELPAIKRGKWIYGFCGNCGKRNPTLYLNESTLPYCPYCGAKMGEEG